MRIVTSWTQLLLVFALAFPAIIAITGTQIIARAEEKDPVDVEAASVADEEEEDEDSVAENEDGLLKPSPDADTIVLFTQPDYGTNTANMEIPAGIVSELLLGVWNRGQKALILDHVEGSLRYPSDFSFRIQNLSAIAFPHGGRRISPGGQATVAYAFAPADAFTGRPFGFVLNVAYHNEDGVAFAESALNATIQIVEHSDSIVDGEAFFLYVFLAACVLLLLVLGQQGLASLGRSGGSRNRGVSSTFSNWSSMVLGFGKGKSKTKSANTSAEFAGLVSAKSGIDLDWIPTETLRQYKKSVQSTSSPHQSPRQRKTKPKRGSGFDD